MSPKVTQEHKLAVRERFLDAAERLFREKGYHETSVDDVVSAVGMSKGSMYGYFDGKEALFESLQRRQIERNIAPARAALGFERSPRSKLRNLINFYLSEHHRAANRTRMDIEIQGAALREKSIKTLYSDAYERGQSALTSLLREGVERDEFKKDIDPYAIAILLVAVSDGLALRSTITDAEIDGERVRKLLIELVLDGISTARV